MEHIISEIITTDEISKWKPEQPVIISADTGTGKSYFIKNKLFEYAKANGKKILFLVHRKNCLKQFQMELKSQDKNDVIKIATYQKLQAMRVEDYEINLSNYDYIVSDEFHYFLSDSLFNTTTDIAFDIIFEQKHAIKIFMSATADDMISYIKELKGLDPLEYSYESDRKHIEAIYVVKEKDFINEICKNATKDAKAILFMQNAKSAFKLYREYEDKAIFCCSKSNTSYGSWVKRKEIDEMLASEKFEKPLLITTSCLDTGVNLVDQAIKYIYVDMYDPGVLLQCIGRKRPSSDGDFVNIVFSHRNKVWIRKRIEDINIALERVKYLKEEGSIAYVKKYGRKVDDFNIIYSAVGNDGIELKINPLMYKKIENNLTLYKELLEDNDPDAYCAYVSKLIKGNCYKGNQQDALYDFFYEKLGEEFLKKNCHLVMDTREQTEAFTKALYIKYKQISKVNATLEERNSGYRVYQYESCRRGKKLGIKEGKVTMVAKKDHVRPWVVLPLEEYNSKIQGKSNDKQGAGVQKNSVLEVDI